MHTFWIFDASRMVGYTQPLVDETLEFKLSFWEIMIPICMGSNVNPGLINPWAGQLGGYHLSIGGVPP